MESWKTASSLHELKNTLSNTEHLNATLKKLQFHKNIEEKKKNTGDTLDSIFTLLSVCSIFWVMGMFYLFTAWFNKASQFSFNLKANRENKVAQISYIHCNTYKHKMREKSSSLFFTTRRLLRSPYYLSK